MSLLCSCQGTAVIQSLREVAECIGFDRYTGLHLPLVDGKPLEQPPACKSSQLYPFQRSNCVTESSH